MLIDYDDIPEDYEDDDGNWVFCRVCEQEVETTDYDDYRETCDNCLSKHERLGE